MGDAWQIPVGAVVLAAALLSVGLWCFRRYRLLRDLPKSRPGGVFIGMVEVMATIRCIAPLRSQLAELPCAWYRWSVEEQWTRTVTETSTDKDGHVHHTTRQESGWTTVASGGDETRFELVDDSGSVQVDPSGARVDGSSSLDAACGRSDPLYYAKGPASAISDSDHRRRFREQILPTDTIACVIGHARERADGRGLEIARDAHTPIFVVSVYGDRAVASGYGWHAFGSFSAGLLVAGLVPAYVVDQRGIATDATIALAAAIGTLAYMLVGCLGWAWMVFNELIGLRQRVTQGWANVDVQLKRRFDLMAQLIPLVQGLAGHEALTDRTLALLRAQSMATPPGNPGPDVHAVAVQLSLVSEAFPDLIAVHQFTSLHHALIDCENHIALARTYFNDIASTWNTRISVIPECWIAHLGRMREQALMADPAGAAPAVPIVVSATHPADAVRRS